MRRASMRTRVPPVFASKNEQPSIHRILAGGADHHDLRAGWFWRLRALVLIQSSGPARTVGEAARRHDHRRSRRAHRASTREQAKRGWRPAMDLWFTHEAPRLDHAILSER